MQLCIYQNTVTHGAQLSGSYMSGYKPKAGGGGGGLLSASGPI